MDSRIAYGSDAKKIILDTTKLVKDLVCSTLGPKGKYVIVQKPFQNPSVTKDGVTVADTLHLKDEIANMVVNVLREAASQTVKQVGDGTTTATLLAAEIIRVSEELHTHKIDSNQVRKVLKEISEAMIEYIKSKSIECSTPEELKHIAYISSNNDNELADLISKAVYAAKESGIVIVEDSKGIETTMNLVNGFRFDRGFVSPYFINVPHKMQCEYENPVILVTDKKIRSTQDISHIMEASAKAQRPLVIIADEIEAQAIALLVTNRVRLNFPVVAIKAPSYGQNRHDNLVDIATFVGAKFFSEEKGDKLSKCTIEDLGTIDKIIVTNQETTLVGDSPRQEETKARIEYLTSIIELQDHEWKKEFIQKRIASLCGSIAVIYVGDKTESAAKEKKFRIDDALQATQTAFKSGYVAGGGVVLPKAFEYVSTEFQSKPVTLDEVKIYEMLREVFYAPMKTMLENSGISDELVEKLVNEYRTVCKDPEQDISLGYDLNNYSPEIVNLIKSNIIDPTQVITSALQAATSAATMLLNTNAIIASEIVDHYPIERNDN